MNTPPVRPQSGPALALAARAYKEASRSTPLGAAWDSGAAERPRRKTRSQLPPFQFRSFVPDGHGGYREAVTQEEILALATRLYLASYGIATPRWLETNVPATAGRPGDVASEVGER